MPLRSDKGRSPDFPYPRTEKDPLGVSTPRGLNPRLLDPFTFLLVFSREEWENRQNWYGVPIRFGCPQAIKKAAGSAAKEGR